MGSAWGRGVTSWKAGAFFALGALLLLLPACREPAPAAEAAACTPGELPAGLPPVAFAVGTVFIHTAEGPHILQVEIAETSEQRDRGLMYRAALPASCGMLFIFPQAHRGSFWMVNTFIPLSVAFADDRGVIFQISDMHPCGNLSKTDCADQDYPASLPFRFALEVNQGYFAQREIRVGDRIERVADGEKSGTVPK